MDIRDIKENPPMIEDGTGLSKIFQMQRELLGHYMKIEGMPPYPIALNSKEDQLLIKDFIGRVIEEMAEGMESFGEMIVIVLGNNDEEKMLINHLQNFNEEMGDSLHFLVELLIYANIDENDIAKFYELKLKKENLTDIYGYGGEDTLKTCLAYARYTNLKANFFDADYKLAKRIMSDEEITEKEYLRAGSRISRNIYINMEILMWRVTYWLNISRNFLKNKPWKQTNMLTDTKRFHEAVMSAWFAYFELMDYIGMTPWSLFTVYFKKNRINLFRITSKY